MEPGKNSLQCIIVTPERAVLDQPADFVALTMHDGELGVLPGRAPLIGRLGFGELRLRQDTQTRRFFIDGGFVQVRGNVISVLTPRAQAAQDINVQTANQALEAARVPGKTPEEQENQLKAQERARAQLRVAQRQHGGEHVGGGH